MASNRDVAPVERTRKSEILETAATVFATSGMRASLQEVADACGILPGSLYHHFASKEDVFVELVKRYQADLEAVAEQAMNAARAYEEPPLERVVSLGTAIAECAVRHRAALL